MGPLSASLPWDCVNLIVIYNIGLKADFFILMIPLDANYYTWSTIYLFLMLVVIKGAGATIFFHTFSSISESKLIILPVAQFKF